MQKCQLLRPPSESYMRWLGRKSANRWRREAQYCPILHCKSLQYSASEGRRLADFWPSILIYDSDGGLKSLYFCFRVVLNLDQKSYQWTPNYLLNIFCFLAGFERFEMFFIDNYAQNLASKWAVWAVFERFIKKIAQKPRNIWTVFLDKPFKTVQILRGFFI